MRWVFLALLVLAGPAFAQDEAALLAHARERGRAIFAYDRAAWLGSDDLLAKLPDAAKKVAGYMVDGPVDTPRLVFFDRQPVPQALYIARFSGGRLVEGKVLRAEDDHAIAPGMLRMIAALATAKKVIATQDVRPCASAPFNTVVLPPAAPDGAIPVYFLTPRTDKDHIPVGGHFEVDVDATGAAGPVRRFTNSCLAMPVKPPPGAQSGALVVSHQRDPVPTELHVFTSLSIGTPVFVTTAAPSPRLWPVMGDRIRPPVDLKK